MEGNSWNYKSFDGVTWERDYLNGFAHFGTNTNNHMILTGNKYVYKQTPRRWELIKDMSKYSIRGIATNGNHFIFPTQHSIVIGVPQSIKEK